MITIDLVVLIPLIFSLLAMFGLWFEKVNWFVSLISIFGAFGIAYYVAPFSEVVFTPFKNSLWYGYDWGLYEIMVGILITIYIIMGVQALYNLYMSNGKKIWG